MSVHHHNLLLHQPHRSPIPNPLNKSQSIRLPESLTTIRGRANNHSCTISSRRRKSVSASAGEGGELDLTEENVRSVLEEAKEELGQLFDTSVGITGVAELADLDGPFVKIRLKGRFWHTRSMVLARLSNFLRQRIPEVLEVEIEDEGQLDDSPANF